MVKARKYVLKKNFEGVPSRDDYEIVEYELPPLKDDEILTKTEWISVDPYHRNMSHLRAAPYDQFGYQVGVVVESKAAGYPVGSRVVLHEGWRDYTIWNTKISRDKDFGNVFYKLPDLQGLSNSLAIGAIGMPGVSSYFGFLEICEPKAGETVVVTGAAGACGSLVGQIAKIKGCKVIGFAGSDDKVKWLETELGFDRAFNYKTVDVRKSLKEAAPEGVDCYFDNVGGEISSQIISQMREYGRVSVLGCISAYNNDTLLFQHSNSLPKAKILQPLILRHQIRLQGTSHGNFSDRWFEAFEQLTKWIKNGQLKAPEHVTVGFDNVFDAFVDMLAGKNYGKAVVKV